MRSCQDDTTSPSAGPFPTPEAKRGPSCWQRPFGADMASHRHWPPASALPFSSAGFRFHVLMQPTHHREKDPGAHAHCQAWAETPTAGVDNRT